MSNSSATITFPSPGAVTDATTVVVRGTTSGPDTVVGVTVNGAAATSTDGFATWRTTVLLQPGQNAMDVTLTDDQGRQRTDAAAIEVEQVGAVLRSPVRLALEPMRDSYLVLESRAQAVLRVERATGIARVVSGAARGSGTEFTSVVGLAYDAGGDVIYVGDRSRDAVFAVDPGTGDRTVLVDSAAASSQGLSGILATPVELVFDDLNRRLLVADSGSDTIYAIDVENGTISLISGGNNAQTAFRRGSGPSMFTASGMDWDEAGNRVVLADNQADQVIAVNLTTGNRSVLSSNSAPSQPSGPDFHTASSLVLDASRRLAYVTDIEQPGAPNFVLEVDLDTGMRRVFAGPGVGTGPDLEFPTFCRFDEANRRMFVGDSYLHAVLAIDLDTGARSSFYDTAVGSGPRLVEPFGTVTDTSRNRLLLADRSANALMAVDLDTGDRSVFTQFDTDTTPYDVAIDTVRDRALVTDVEQDRVLAVDLGTGASTELQVAGLSNVRHIGFDPSRDLAVVARAVVSNGRAVEVWAIDLGNPDPSTGEHPATLLSRSSTPAAGSGPNMSDILDLCVDPGTDVALVLEGSGGNQVLAVDLDSGDRSLISGASRGSGPALQTVRSFVPRPGSPALLVLNGDGRAVVSVDLNTGDRSEVSRSGLGDGPGLEAGVDIAAGRVGALVLDGQLGVLGVDLGTGDRVITSSR